MTNTKKKQKKLTITKDNDRFFVYLNFADHSLTFVDQHN